MEEESQDSVLEKVQSSGVPEIPLIGGVGPGALFL